MSEKKDKVTIDADLPVNRVRRFPGIPKHWEDYLLSILFMLVLPLLPIGIEYWRVGRVETAELMLTASMYAISAGTATSSRLFFGLSMIFGVIFAFAYGVTKGQITTLRSSELAAYIIIALIFIFHCLERYNVHIAESRPWDFPGEKRR